MFLFSLSHKCTMCFPDSHPALQKVNIMHPVHRGLSSPNILTWQRLGQLSPSTNSPLLSSPHTHTWLHHTQCLCHHVTPFAPHSWLERPLSHLQLGEASYFSRLALVWISDFYCSLMNVYPHCHHFCQPSWNT